ncbi:MAG TPA: hypothetical protein VFQ13_06325 [Anaerolineales bacterium]|nr:hypothetical protein [Anaerolineales bacterium]
MHYLIGIDDTDNLETRGTGHRARQLANWLAENKLSVPKGITRHQLLVHPQISYTSHNSSACLSVETKNAEDLWEASREFLLREGAIGSDVGLCLAEWERINEEVRSFGRRAKIEVLTMLAAQQLASRFEIRCEGLMGTGGGVIGALAGIGLHRAGNDGRFLWLPGLRELKGKYPIAEVMAQGHIERVCTLDYDELSPEEIVDVGEWVRPVLLNGKSTLLVEEQDHEWHTLMKERIKNLSN